MNTLFGISDELAQEKVEHTYSISSELLLGQIIQNKISGMAYDKLNLKSIQREARICLGLYRERNLLLTNYFLSDLRYISELFSQVSFNYAFLKGAYLTHFLYELGHRTSNDIDIFVAHNDISDIQKVLQNNGFVQGTVETNEIVLASRKEIIESKMNNGQTVPFVKHRGDHFFEVDLNFSLDFKPAQDERIVSEMLSSTILVEKEDLRFMTLRFDDFLIHLSCHLYKEATTYEWVESRRDLMLYKFSDINVFVHNHGTADYCNRLIDRIKHFHLEKECYYTFENASIIYPNLNNIESFVNVKESIKPSNLDFMKQVIWPSKKKRFQHNLDFKNWFFCLDRVAQLKEIPYEND